MSMPPTLFTCNGCDFQASGRIMWGRFYYQLDDGNLVPLKRNLWWCSSCNCPSPVEDLSIDNTPHGRKLSRPEGGGSLIRYLFSSLSALRFTKQAAYERRVLKEKMALMDILRARTGPPRCLICSSSDVIPHDFQSIDDSGPRDLPRSTGFVHPGCGGTIMAGSSGISLIMQTISRSYTTEGMLIREWYK